MLENDGNPNEMDQISPSDTLLYLVNSDVIFSPSPAAPFPNRGLIGIPL